MVKQYIVVRKDLPMSSGKMAAQVSHASIAFLTWMISRNIKKTDDGYVVSDIVIDKNLWEGWMDPEYASFTKVVLQVKNKNQLEKVIKKAEENGLAENKDFFCIRDEGRTELGEYRDEDGRVFTCIGFKPCEETKLKDVVGKLQVYKS